MILRSGEECNAKGCFFALAIHFINMRESNFFTKQILALKKYFFIFVAYVRIAQPHDIGIYLGNLATLCTRYLV